MDRETLGDVTKALDVAISRVAKDRIAGLRHAMESADIARSSCSLYRELGDLKLPRYGKWDALSYLVWYHPSQINLVYTILTQKIPKEKNPFLKGDCCLEVTDFGCGQLATAFGVSLAAADVVKDHHTIPQIKILRDDNSDDMKALGWEIWREFINQIASRERYPKLDHLRMVRDEMMKLWDKQLENQGKGSVIRWLTAIHVAYEENAHDVKKQLDDRVSELDPELILVTSHRKSRQRAFVPTPSRYEKNEYAISECDMDLYGQLREVTELRANLYDEIISDMMPKELVSDMYKYWKDRPTCWTRPAFDVIASIYWRTGVTVDDLPF